MSTECVVGESGEESTSCVPGVVLENDASHPVCPDDTLMSGFIFTVDDKPGCRCTGCADTWASNQVGLPDVETQNNGQKMSISYNCMKQASYAAPFGECRVDFHPMRTIQLGAGSVSDLKVLEQFNLACGAGEALKSFMTTTHDSDHSKMGWKFTCCKSPKDNRPAVFREGPCFATSLNALTSKQKGTKWANPMRYLGQDKGAACGPGEVLTSWAVKPCPEKGNEEGPQRRILESGGDPSEFECTSDYCSHFVFECQPVGGVPSPPPPAPPPPIDDSFDNLDWVGDFAATAKIAFGKDLNDAMLQKVLGIIKVRGDFSITEGEFKMDELDVSVAVAFTVPAKNYSWQKSQNLNELEITGFANLKYPCRTFTDPATVRRCRMNR